MVVDSIGVLVVAGWVDLVVFGKVSAWVVDCWIVVVPRISIRSSRSLSGDSELAKAPKDPNPARIPSEAIPMRIMAISVTLGTSPIPI